MSVNTDREHVACMINIMHALQIRLLSPEARRNQTYRPQPLLPWSILQHELQVHGQMAENSIEPGVFAGI